MQKVEFISRYEMKRRVKHREDFTDVAIISISDTSTEYVEMRALLQEYNYNALCFNDTDDETGMSSLQAEVLLKFIQENYDKKFIVHCFAGVSRSAAVAKFINEFYELGDWYLEDYKCYNKRVYNKLMAAAGLSLAAYYEELEKKDRMVK